MTVCTIFQGKIESETWAGVTKGAEVLEDHFRKIDKSATKSAPKSVGQKSDHQSTKKTELEVLQNPGLLSSWKWSPHLILSVICLILILLISCLFKMASTLDKIDQRLDFTKGIS